MYEMMKRGFKKACFFFLKLSLCFRITFRFCLKRFCVLDYLYEIGTFAEAEEA